MYSAIGKNIYIKVMILISTYFAWAYLKVTLQSFVGTMIYAEQLPHCSHRPDKITNMEAMVTQMVQILYICLYFPALLAL